jgi:hypothetical protein
VVETAAALAKSQTPDGSANAMLLDDDYVSAVWDEPSSAALVADDLG